MKKYKAVVSDFDGTLVNHEFYYSQNVKKAILAYISGGGIFTIATGRMYQGIVEQICRDLGLSDLVIVRGGSEIVSRKDNKVIWGAYINPKTVDSVLTFLNEQKGLQFAAERGEYIYSKDTSISYLGKKDVFRDLSKMPFDHVPKITVPSLHTEAEADTFLKYISSHFSNLHVVKTTGRGGFGIDINDGGAGKHVAVLEYTKLTNLNPHELIGVGDSYNDYPLLSACGLKVAMGNAPKELKDIADHIVGTQAEEGILEVLELAK